MHCESVGVTLSEYRYDAYLSYAATDRQWVEEQLVPRLTEAGRRVCLEDDLTPGGVELEERSRAVAESRKTLAVVSGAYLSNRWSVVEEAITAELDPAARKRRLIPVLHGDARLPLRIRPLVAVDLRDESDERQWRRLLRALDPAQDDWPMSLAQRWTLSLAEATSDLEYPTWSSVGALYLLASYLTFVGVVSLLLLLLWEAPALRHSVAVVLLATSHVLAALVWREDRDLFRRWSHLLDRSVPARLGIVLWALVVATLWMTRGAPEARELLCGPWGCKEPGKLFLVVDELVDASSGSEAFGVDFHHDVAQKLQAVPEIEVFGVDLPTVDSRTRRRLTVDYSITGRLGPALLTVSLWDRHHRPAPPQVVVPVRGLGDPERRIELANALARALLERLGFEPTPELSARIERIPTDEPRAIAHNAEGFELLREERYEEAFARFEEALDLDPDYSVAWSNLGEAAWRLGAYDQALKYRRQAVDRLPTSATFHYNLGHSLAWVGRYREALESLLRAIELDPARVGAYNEIANVLLALGKPDRAAGELRRALLLEPNFAPASKNLGRALLATNEPRQAVRPLKQALDLYPLADVPGRNETLALLVQAYVRLGDDLAACDYLETARDLDPAGIFPFTPSAEKAAVGLPCAEPLTEEDLRV